jgi:hypothetical protein
MIELRIEMTAITERRRKSRASGKVRDLLVVMPEKPGIHPGATFKAQSIDANTTGLGVRIPQPLAPGSLLTIEGVVVSTLGDRQFTTPARVTWCAPVRDGGFRAGIVLKNPDVVWGTPQQQKPHQPAVDPHVANAEPDHYDLLQLSAKADPDTIHRVYRILAQRYHPDNTETGHEDAFRAVHLAYTVLSNPELRAAYDVRRAAAYAYRIKIFSRPADTEGIEGEQRKRRGILMVLYTQRMSDPEHPGVVLAHLEELLGIPREHLEFPLWFLREHGHLSRTDNGRYSITAKGAAAYETMATPSSASQPASPVALLSAASA